MSPRRKVIYIVLGTTCIIAVLLFTLALLAPRLINVDAIKTPILARLERQTGVRLSFDHAEFAFFPRPRLVLEEVSLSFPSLAEGTVKRLEADISLLALLRNRLLIGSLLAVSPDFRVRTPQVAKGEDPPSLEEIEERGSRLLAGMTLRAPGATFTIREGRLTLSEGDHPLLSLRDVQARVSLPPDRLRFRLSCVSSHWDFLDTEGSLRSEGLRGEARVEVKGLRPMPVLERLAPGKVAFLDVSSLSVRARIESEGVRSLRADVFGTIPSLELRRGSRSLALKGTILEGAVRMEEGNLQVSVSRLDLEAPNLRLSGNLAMERESPRFRLELSGREAEIPPLRSAILSLAGELPAVRSAIDIVREGSLHRFSARVSGNSAAELADLRALEASAILRGGVISIPDVGLRLTEVGGSVTLSKGALTGEGVTAMAVGARLPFPLAIDGGKIAYEGSRVEGFGLQGRMGDSSFSGLTGRLELGEVPEVSIHAGQARFSVDELVPWLSSTGFAREALRDVKSARGTAHVSSIAAEGPLGGRGEWRYESSGKINDLVLELASLPGPVTVRRSGFRLLPRSASFPGFVAELLDAKAGGSAEIRFSGEGISRVDASVEDGGFGPAMAEWVSPRLKLPQEVAIRAPLSVSGAAFSWEKGGPISFRGELGHPDGAKVSISLRKSQEELAIDSVALRDRDSNADLSFHLRPKDLRMKYEGTLHHSTVEKFVAGPADAFQTLIGSMELSVDLESPERSQARGMLEGEGIRIPWKPLAPLRIRSFSLSGDGREIQVASADLAWREVPLRMRGKGRLSEDGLEAEVDVETGDVPLERWLPQTPEPAETTEGIVEPRGANGGFRLPKIPVRGTFRLHSDSIRYDRWAVQEVTAHGELGKDSLNVEVFGADLCGLPLQGQATLDSAALALELRTEASGKDLNQPIMCLFDKRVSMTGSFELGTRLVARGRNKEDLIRSIEGPLEFTARDGRIYRMTLLSRILSLLNVTSVVRGTFPDIRQEGISYESLKILGEYRAETLLVKEGTFRGPTLGIASTGEVDFRNSKVDMKVLAAPFRTADWIIRKIPLVRDIMGKTLVSVPFKVTGDVKDPSVAFDPAGVGTGLLGILERTFMLPVKVAEDVLPKTDPPK